ncbi:MAG TPA: response regulator transcription factor [Usitatibacter sp.]|jgi:DNA-binding response OmpR family regulator|nr:response regulator transcription factor [Usitatibacter sp.]
MTLVPRFEATLVRNRAQPVKPRDGMKHSLLVVEDDPDLLKLVGEIMRTAGFSMRFARSLAELRNELRSGGLPDVMLLDVQLPDADGFEILEEIRGNARFEGLPVMMMTGRSQGHHVARGLALGADGYITKPFRMSQLVTAVNAVLGRA